MSSAKFITNDLGSLPGALGPRTTDTNKNLALQALEMVGDLGRFHSSLCEIFLVCILKGQCHEMELAFDDMYGMVSCRAVGLNRE